MVSQTITITVDIDLNQFCLHRQNLKNCSSLETKMGVIIHIDHNMLRCIRQFIEFLIKNTNGNIVTNLNENLEGETIVVICKISPFVCFSQKNRLVFFSTEQSSTKAWKADTQQNIEQLNLNPSIYAIDYSKENIDYYETNLGLPKDRMRCIEPLELNIYDKSPKSNDATGLINDLWINGHSVRHRTEFFRKYMTNFSSRFVNFLGHYDQNRKNILNRSKILVNVHADSDYIICETFRIHEAIACRCIVVSQRCYREDLITLKDYIYFEDDENIPKRCQQILDNYEEEYAKIYGKKTDEEIFAPIIEKNNQEMEKLKAFIAS